MPVADSPYIFKFNRPLSEIRDEDTAIAVLSGLEPEFFIRARGLKNKAASTASDKKFARDYSAFIAEESSRFFIFEIAYDRIKAKRLWNGDFQNYLAALHNDGVFLERDVYDYLKSEGFELRYADNSPAMQCYRTALARKLWTLDEAVSLFAGTEIDGYEFTDLRKETVAIRKLDPSRQNLDGNREEVRRREWCYEDKNTGRCEILRDWLARHTATEKIVAHEKGGTQFYDPVAIVEWLLNVTGQKPVPILDEILFQKETVALSAFRTGFPGRPGSKRLIEQEFERRIKSGSTADKLAEEARQLLKWLIETYPAEAPPTLKVIENNIRDRYRQQKGKKRTA